MITVKFFASFRERLGKEEMTIDANAISTVADIVDSFSTTLPKWIDVVGDNNVLCAVNHTIVDISSPVNDGDEVAFFPPVTGG